MDFFIGYVLGFATAGIITFLWYHGTLRPRFEVMKKLAAGRLEAAAEKMKAKL